MKIIKNIDKNWEERKGYSKKILLTEKELNKPGALIQEIRIRPEDKPLNHHHNKQTEIFYFLTDSGYWLVNGKKITPKVGDLLVIEPGDIHSAWANSTKDYIYLAFKYDYDPKDFYWD